PDQWHRLVERFEAAGLSQKKFCASEGLNENTFRLWRSRVRSARNVSVPFVEVVPVTAAESPWAIELELPSGVKLRLRG
ncbi:MAG: hypothetical protein WBA34_03330, partial [Candidatus Deferrimicrobiaceae bacterium]